MSTAANEAAHPSWMSMAVDRMRVELKEFLRSREQMIFIFLFPMMLLVLFGSIFGEQTVGDPPPGQPAVTFSQYFLAGMIATGILNTGFQSLAITISIDRDADVLKRIYSTPLPATAYFAGKLAQVVLVSLVQIAILVGLGVALYDVTLPAESGPWLTFAWVFLLGTAASVVLGIATSSLLRNAKAASAILTPVVLVLQFTSGVFFVYTQLSSGLQQFAALFPLKWLAQGMRSVFLPDYFAEQEVAGSWEHPMTAVVLAAWFVIGLVVSVRTFRWMRPEDS
ncbi:ABC transporter permease [Demequina sp. TTPB684]|uniref:ABC transporter permease n=1 Tax=unclassified Demequina TaxID=2620311 RepID=UPI001CF57C24|nr:MULTISPECIES: ABC transporter permease [unclassified Demequina]MCB2413200.1 ABC transporter permease [Demequina sp. TTPB684]UPU88375.1 ABC transporter permease [Demequina sp. TMPB413]